MSMDIFEAQARKRAVAEAENNGEVADSMSVRLALMARVHSGEITLAQAQDELKRIQRGVRNKGQITRSQAWGES